MIELTPVESDAIRALGHDPATNELHVEFKHGGRYVYQGVTAAEHEALMGAPSVGGHFHAHIKSRKLFRALPRR